MCKIVLQCNTNEPFPFSLPVSVLLKPGNAGHVFKYELSVRGLVIICVCQDFIVLVCV